MIVGKMMVDVLPIDSFQVNLIQEYREDPPILPPNPYSQNPSSHLLASPPSPLPPPTNFNQPIRGSLNLNPPVPEQAPAALPLHLDAYHNPSPAVRDPKPPPRSHSPPPRYASNSPPTSFTPQQPHMSKDRLMDECIDVWT